MDRTGLEQYCINREREESGDERESEDKKGAEGRGKREGMESGVRREGSQTTPSSFNKGPINRVPNNRMVTSGDPALDPSKLIILIILKGFWVYQALGDMLSITVSNSHFGNALQPEK